MSAVTQATGTRPARGVRARLSASPGFTIIEVLVATLVLTIGIVAVLTSFTSSQKLGTSAEAHQTAAALAEAELERVRGLKWSAMAMTAEPSRSTEASVPTFYEVSPATATCPGNGPTEERCYEWNWSATSVSEPLVVEAGGAVTEDPRTVTVAVTSAHGSPTRLTYSIYSFITWANDSSCTVSKCKGKEDTKRILVAVTGSDLDKPITVVSLVNDSEPIENPLKGRRCEEESGTKVECVSQK